jgi:hypothetical protein
MEELSVPPEFDSLVVLEEESSNGGEAKPISEVVSPALAKETPSLAAEPSPVPVPGGQKGDSDHSDRDSENLTGTSDSSGSNSLETSR